MALENNSFSLPIENFPGAFAYHQIILDDHGTPADYIFLEVNSAFEEMTGLKRKMIIGKKVTEVLPGIIKSEFDWIGTYGKVAISGEPVFFESFSEPLGRWYDVSAYSDKHGYFAVVFHDTTNQKKLERELNESKKRFQLILDTQQEMISHYLPDTTLIFVNQAYCRTFGLSESELIGRKFLEHIPPDYQEKLLAIINGLTPQQPAKTHEHQALLPDGTLCWQEWTDQGIFNEAGELIEFQAVGRDITARKQAEDKLRKTQLTVDKSPLSVFWITPEGKFIYTNEAATEKLGYTPDELLSMHVWDVDPHYPRENREEQWNLHRKKGKRIVESEHRRRDGTTFPVRINIYHLAFEGQEMEVAEVEDITERKQAEEALRNSEEKYRRLFETMTQGVIYQNSDGKIDSANPAAERILGLTADQMQGKTSMDSRWQMIEKDGKPVPGENHPSMIALRTGQTIGPVTRGIYRPDLDKHIWLNITAIPLFQPNNKDPVQAYATFEDITERIKAEEEVRTLNKELEQRVKERTFELEAVNKELESFAYSISHDFRAPLRALNAYIANINEKYSDQLDEQGVHYLNRISNASLYMSHLIDDLLKLSRITRIELKEQAVDISILSEEIIRDLQEAEPTRRVKVNIEPGLSAKGDITLLKAALENLIGNAWKFSSKERKPKIKVGVTKKDGENVYFISDNGVGFNMAYADKLFGAFQRLHRVDEFPGTGIGLATVQRIIDRHGGRIWAESEMGKGATFYFTLGHEKAGK